jgi:RNA repair, ligase-Pnkp-associating, region of Hen1
MLLTITTTHRPATDLGYLLHKHPERFQSFDLSFGKAHVYYPEVGTDRCTACLLLDVDSTGSRRPSAAQGNARAVSGCACEFPSGRAYLVAPDRHCGA